MLTLSLLEDAYAVCRLAPDAQVPDWSVAGPLFSITRTADELSVVCPQRDVPEDVRSEGGWRCLKLRGPFDLSSTGMMASLAGPLAEAQVSIFVFSTFDTDYLMVKESSLERAIGALVDAGHRVEQ